MMLFNKSFMMALAISTLGHSVLFWQLPGLERMLPMQKVLKPLEIAYYEIKEEPEELPEQKPVPIVVTPAKYEEIKEALKEVEKPPAHETQALEPFPEPDPKKEDKKEEVAKEDALKEKVEIPASLPRESEPVYLDYYQTVRERIRFFASYHYRRRFAVGDVRLAFVLSRSGKLKQLKVLDKDSSQSRFLREVAIRSVKTASPFPPFPEELDLPQLSFNVIISFELEK